ncbi:peptidyl-prolyl cis-trans isomerase [Pichia membranifaciens]|uniref:peptidylprolyl isomerase n=1 Tax=Pichia membranifaciens TaxID=4926 RepID=A0A1Q2YIE2_9ASCO|nr:peptidyl-prolyl cis-trans isomerase [Pichia membranifaciens]
MSTATPDKLDIEIISPGDGKTFPKSGDLLTVHYTGTLTNGKKFDSSVDRNRPFQFRIGQGMVIQGWEQGFAKLSLGEKARLTVPPLMAYGERGFPGLIPPMSPLIFDVDRQSPHRSRGSSSFGTGRSGRSGSPRCMSPPAPPRAFPRSPPPTSVGPRAGGSPCTSPTDSAAQHPSSRQCSTQSHTAHPQERIV